MWVSQASSLTIFIWLTSSPPSHPSFGYIIFQICLLFFLFFSLGIEEDHGGGGLVHFAVVICLPHGFLVGTVWHIIPSRFSSRGKHPLSQSGLSLCTFPIAGFSSSILRAYPLLPSQYCVLPYSRVKHLKDRSVKQVGRHYSRSYAHTCRQAYSRSYAHYFVRRDRIHCRRTVITLSSDRYLTVTLSAGTGNLSVGTRTRTGQGDVDIKGNIGNGPRGSILGSG